MGETKEKNIMKKRKMSVYIIGAVSIAVIGMLLFLTCVIATGSVHIRKKQIVIQTASDDKQYDGRPLTCDEYMISSGKIAKEHSLEVRVTGERTSVGVGENTAEVIVRDAGGFDVTDQYKIVVEAGKLEVHPPKIRLVSDDETFAYSGDPKSCEHVFITKRQLREGEQLYCTDFREVTEPGVYENTFCATILDENGNDITNQYEIEYVYGQLKVICSALTLRAESAEKEYDGKPLTAEEWVLEEGSLMEGHRLDVRSRSSIVQTGSCQNIIVAKVYDSNGKDVSDFYRIDTIPGELTIVPRHLVIRTKDVQRRYGDKAVENDWEILEGSPAEGENIFVRTTQQNEALRFGEYDNLVSLVTIRNEKAKTGNVSSCYQIEYVCGHITILE